MKEVKKWMQEQMQDTKIPDSLSPEQMEKKITDRKQKSKIRFIVPRVAVAACVAFVAVGSAVLVNMGGISGTKEQRNSGTQMEVADAGVRYADLYQSVKGYYEKQESNLKQNIYAVNEDIAATEDTTSTGIMAQKSMDADSSADSSASSASSDYSKTDLQVSGVDEGDQVLTDGKYIYTIEAPYSKNSCYLHILDAGERNPKEIKKLTIEMEHYCDMYLDSEHEKIYLIGWKEIRKASSVKSSEQEENDGDTAGYSMAYRLPFHGVTTVHVVDISDKKYPKVIKELSQDGFYNNSRLSDGYLYLFSSYSVRENNPDDIKEDDPSTYVPCVNGEVMEEGCIVMPMQVENDMYTVITSLDLSSPSDFCEKEAVYGGQDVLYMSQSCFYLTRSIYPHEEASEGLVSNIKDALSFENTIKTKICKFEYKDGKIKMTAEGKITGEVRDSYALHEYKGNLCVVYTKHGKKTTNGLCVLDKDLKKAGKIGNLGVDEEIYSSYYIKNMAYFVTYRTTDPVFAVDVSDPKEPKLKSELKLPGYSDYLHSFGENQMVGLGYEEETDNEGIWEANHIKISMFDIDENQVVTESFREVFDNYNTMDLQNHDHREVFVDEERGLLGFLVYHGADNVFRYFLYEKQGTKLVPVYKEKLRESDTTNDCFRGVRIGDVFYVVSDKGRVKSYDLVKKTALKEEKNEAEISESECITICQNYLRDHASEEIETITNMEEPEVTIVEKLPESYYEISDGKGKAPYFKVVFHTTQDELLGSIDFFVDQTGEVVGQNWRE